MSTNLLFHHNYIYLSQIKSGFDFQKEQEPSTKLLESPPTEQFTEVNLLYQVYSCTN